MYLRALTMQYYNKFCKYKTFTLNFIPMPFPADPELPKFKEDIGLIKPKLDKYYGVLVGNKFPTIDVKKLHQAVAGRVVYHEGLNALRLQLS